MNTLTPEISENGGAFFSVRSAISVADLFPAAGKQLDRRSEIP